MELKQILQDFVNEPYEKLVDMAIAAFADINNTFEKVAPGVDATQLMVSLFATSLAVDGKLTELECKFVSDIFNGVTYNEIKELVEAHHSAEMVSFIDEFVKYVTGSQENQSLKDFFKTVDLLLVDDIQFLSDKVKTAEMFFYIFNALVNNGKQVVLTSDRHPKDLKGLEERLVSRFNMGLSEKIHRPDTDTMLEILKRKIISHGLTVSNYDEEGLLYLAETFSRNVRELEGALNRFVRLINDSNLLRCQRYHFLIMF